MNSSDINKNFWRVKTGLFQETLIRVCLFVSVLVVINTCYTLYLNYWHGPFRDMWEIFPFLIDAVESRWHWGELWALYGGAHRLVVPKLLYVADYQWFAGNNHLLLLTSVVCQIFITVFFFKAIWVQGTDSKECRTESSRPIKYLMSAFVLALQFSATLMFNFLHTFDVQWFTCCLFIVICFFVLLLPVKHSIALLYLSLFFGLLATMSNFAGMAFWPVWLVLVLKKGYSWKTVALVFAVSSIYILCYVSAMSGVHSSDLDKPFFELLLFLFVFFLFPALFLSSPLSEFHPFAGAFLSVPVLMLLARFWWLYLVRKQQFPRICVFFAALALFCYGVSAEIALGRWYGPEHYHASRYQNIVVMFWSAFFCLWLSLPESVFRVFFSRLNFAGFLARKKIVLCTSVFVVIFVAYQYPSTSQAYSMGTNVRLAHLAFTLGYSDKVPLIMATKSRHWAGIEWHNFNREYQFMKDHGVGPMSEPAYRLYESGLPSGQYLKKLPICPGLGKVRIFPHVETAVIQFSVTLDTAFMSEYAPSSIHVFSDGRPLGYAIPYYEREPLAHFKKSLSGEGVKFFGYLTDQPARSILMLAGSGGRYVCKLSN
ncbi:MAG: hypothetical protein KDI30_12560 [Pseudomonadales bacterium]|nr:hypothetical protein [Pseudomonadales bacterium]